MDRPGPAHTWWIYNCMSDMIEVQSRVFLRDAFASTESKAPELERPEPTDESSLKPMLLQPELGSLHRIKLLKFNCRGELRREKDNLAM